MPSSRGSSLAWRRAAFAALALVLASLYALRLVVFGGRRAAPAVLLALQGVGTAALLGLLVWRLMRARRWRRLAPWTRWAMHAVLAPLFAIIWAVAHLGTNELLVGRELAHRAWLAMGWELLAGLMLYALSVALAESFELARRLERERTRAAQARLLASEARLEALRARLQPHFLFNALHSLSGLVRSDPDRVARGLEELGSLLRAALDRNCDRLSLAEEWRFTQRYLELERLRLGDRLTLVSELPAETLRCEVPPFTLQPLVENAVRHGIAPRPGPARLRVTAAVEGAGLLLEVADDGLGADPAAVDRAPGSGLRNLRERLRAAHGGAALLQITTAPGRGFSARLRLPAGETE